MKRTILFFALGTIVSLANCTYNYTHEHVRTNKGFYRFYYSDTQRGTQAEFCSVDGKTGAINCKSVDLVMEF